ncbi:MAG TPA: condensation domain-containing protein, partial [Vicinamibacteria bacterium]
MSQIVEGYRLSPPQRRLWTVWGSAASAPCGAFAVVEVEGPVEWQALSAALARVVERHEILRTAFRRIAGMALPLQVIAENGYAELLERDLQELASAEQEAEIERLLLSMRSEPFELEGGGSLRATLAKLGPRRSLLILGLPALCADGEGLSLLVREIARSYGHDGSPRNDEPFQYCDLAEWLNELLESEDTRKGRDYWSARVQPAWTTLRLPIGKTNLSAAPQHFREAAREVPETVFRRAREQALRFEAAPADFLLACWQAFLWRFSGENDFALAVEYGGRQHEPTREAFGPFARSLPFPSRLEAGVVFGEAVRAAAREAREIGRRQDFFTWEAVDGGNEVRFLPFGFVFRSPSEPLSASGIRFTMKEERVLGEPYRIRLSCQPVSTTLRIRLSFDADFLDAADAERLLGQLQVFIE